MFKRREKVFVSYSSRNQLFVDEDILPQVSKARRDFWYAPKDIGVGHDWRQKLREGMDACSRLLVVVSKDAVASKEVKIEVSDSASKLLRARAKLDARRVHRAILPVLIDPRDQFGAKLHSPEQPIELFNLHPFLALVHFLAIPYNAELNKELDPQTGSYRFNRITRRYRDPQKSLTRKQLKSINRYVKERREAKRKLVIALRNPDALRWNFRRVARFFAVFLNPSLQRGVLIAGVAVALFLLLQLPGSLLDRYLHPADPAAPIINIHLEPLGIRTESLDEASPDNRDRSTATTLVRGPWPRNDHQSKQVAQSEVRVVPIAADAAKRAIENGRNVWRISAIAPGGKLTQKYLMLETKVTMARQPAPQIDVQVNRQRAAASTQPTRKIVVGRDPMDLQIIATTSEGTAAIEHVALIPEVDQGEIAIQADGKQVDLGEIPVGKDPLDLRVFVRHADGTHGPQRQLTVRRDRTPKQIEVFLKSSDNVVAPVEVASDYAKSPSVSIDGSVSLALRIKDEPESGTYFAKLLPPDPKLEIQVDGETVKWGAAERPMDLSVGDQPRLVRVRVNNSTDWRYAKLNPAAKPEPPRNSVWRSSADGWQAIDSVDDLDVDRPQWLLVQQTFEGNKTDVWRGIIRPPRIAVEQRRNNEDWQTIESQEFPIPPSELRVARSSGGKTSVVWQGRFKPPAPPQVSVIAREAGQRDWVSVLDGAQMTIKRRRTLQFAATTNGKPGTPLVLTLDPPALDPPSQPQGAVAFQASRDRANWKPVAQGITSIDYPTYFRIVSSGDGKSSLAWEGRFDPRTAKTSVVVEGSQDRLNWVAVPPNSPLAKYAKYVRVVGYEQGGRTILWAGTFTPAGLPNLFDPGSRPKLPQPKLIQPQLPAPIKLPTPINRGVLPGKPRVLPTPPVAPF